MADENGIPTSERQEEIRDRLLALEPVDLTEFSDVSAAEWRDMWAEFADMLAERLEQDGWPEPELIEYASRAAAPLVSVLMGASGGVVDVMELLGQTARVGVAVGVASVLTGRITEGTARAILDEHVRSSEVAARTIDFSRKLGEL